jgi:hypothetical protein
LAAVASFNSLLPFCVMHWLPALWSSLTGMAAAARRRVGSGRRPLNPPAAGHQEDGLNAAQAAN